MPGCARYPMRSTPRIVHRCPRLRARVQPRRADEHGDQHAEDPVPRQIDHSYAFDISVAGFRPTLSTSSESPSTQPYQKVATTVALATIPRLIRRDTRRARRAVERAERRGSRSAHRAR